MSNAHSVYSVMLSLVEETGTSNERKTTFCKALRIFYHRTFLNRVHIAMDDSRDESITTTFNA